MMFSMPNDAHKSTQQNHYSPFYLSVPAPHRPLQTHARTHVHIYTSVALLLYYKQGVKTKSLGDLKQLKVANKEQERNHAYTPWLDCSCMCRKVRGLGPPLGKRSPPILGPKSCKGCLVTEVKPHNCKNSVVLKGMVAPGCSPLW